MAPHDPLRITLEDLLKCGKGPVVVRLLTDVNGFVDYENRESLLLQEENDKEN